MKKTIAILIATLISCSSMLSLSVSSENIASPIIGDASNVVSDENNIMTFTTGKEYLTRNRRDFKVFYEIYVDNSENVEGIVNLPEGLTLTKHDEESDEYDLYCVELSNEETMDNLLEKAKTLYDCKQIKEAYSQMTFDYSCITDHDGEFYAVCDVPHSPITLVTYVSKLADVEPEITTMVSTITETTTTVVTTTPQVTTSINTQDTVATTTVAPTTQQSNVRNELNLYDLVTEITDKYAINNDDYKAAIDEIYDKPLSSDLFGLCNWPGERKYIKEYKDDNLSVILENFEIYCHEQDDTITNKLINVANTWNCVELYNGKIELGKLGVKFEDTAFTQEEINTYLTEIGVKARCTEIFAPGNYETIYLNYDSSVTMEEKIQIVLKLCEKFGFEPYNSYGVYSGTRYIDNNLTLSDLNAVVYPDGNVPINTALAYILPIITTTTTVVTTAPSETVSTQDISEITTSETTKPIVHTLIITKAPTETTDKTTTTTQSPTDENIPSGDANGDIEVNVRDCSFIAMKIASGKTESLPISADFNGDGKVNVRDAAAIASYLATK